MRDTDPRSDEELKKELDDAVAQAEAAAPPQTEYTRLLGRFMQFRLDVCKLQILLATDAADALWEAEQALEAAGLSEEAARIRQKRQGFHDLAQQAVEEADSL